MPIGEVSLGGLRFRHFQQRGIDQGPAYHIHRLAFSIPPQQPPTSSVQTTENLILRPPGTYRGVSQSFPRVLRCLPWQTTVKPLPESRKPTCQACIAILRVSATWAKAQYFLQGDQITGPEASPRPSAAFRVCLIPEKMVAVILSLACLRVHPLPLGILHISINALLTTRLPYRAPREHCHHVHKALHRIPEALVLNPQDTGHSSSRDFSKYPLVVPGLVHPHVVYPLSSSTRVAR
jgi:hypothetical protein